MRVVNLPDPETVARFAASEIRRLIDSNPYSVLGLATGGTPVGVYLRLIEMHRNEGLSFRNITTFNLDEYIGLASDHPQSYRAFMQEHLFQHVDIGPENTHLPSGVPKDLFEECKEYEGRIARAGGIDLQLLGIGSDGHIAFNEPGSSLASRTRVKTLTEQTRRDNARFFDSPEQVPTAAITMGIGTILDADRILLIATGSSKAEAVQATVEGPVTSRAPASALQLHANVTIVVDDAAASRLTFREYYQRSESERLRLEKSHP
jgi:glucosamine-6-phosphate deaminase